jgi:hypothetical protein
VVDLGLLPGLGRVRVPHGFLRATESVYRKVIVPELRRGAEVMDQLFG